MLLLLSSAPMFGRGRLATRFRYVMPIFPDPNQPEPIVPSEDELGLIIAMTL